ncbi:adenine phosphoribosyltransferase [Actinomarinicola tropica]|uniref:Adenine phosphoribosyltransferase n=1 Tax=Actinomarinicola tropica TaxID=2789776 RepID=A0A5Q2RRN5_9ACTN|nr:adenine phosphoribosyltransferase [Actinomarinicola tropica]QGG96560.1 adenine phosphoribosyltransferase [Actinomarinicola tropica]
MADDLDLGSYIRDVADWPQPGVTFKDITPLLADPAALAATIDRLAGHFIGRGITKVVGIEARGFVVAAPVAYRLDAGFVPARKPGKLPWGTESEAYDLEYGTDELEIHVDAVTPGEKVLVVDDVLATGGTASAAIRLVQAVGGDVVGLGVIIELGFLGGAAKLGDVDLVSLLTYD